jgi:pyruvate formate lyase activating enzyme
MMKIKALQKTTLIDYPGKIACTLFLYGCNFRCGFCHNPELVLENLEGDYSVEYSNDEILDFLKKRRKYLDGVCITGGEPLIDIDIDFLKKIKKLGYKIKIDTNGSFPEKIEKLIKKKLVNFISMDVKASRERYKDVVNAQVNLENIEKSMKLISGLDDYEFRTTVIEGFHEKKEIRHIIKWISSVIDGKIKIFCLQGFKNKGKLVDKNFAKYKNTSEEFLQDLKKMIMPYCEEVFVRV